MWHASFVQSWPFHSLHILLITIIMNNELYEYDVWATRARLFPQKESAKRSTVYCYRSEIKLIVFKKALTENGWTICTYTILEIPKIKLRASDTLYVLLTYIWVCACASILETHPIQSFPKWTEQHYIISHVMLHVLCVELFHQSLCVLTEIWKSALGELIERWQAPLHK